MAGVLFPAAQVGVLIVPLMLFHQIQLMVCAVIARRYASRQATAAPDLNQSLELADFVEKGGVEVAVGS
jgi:predicted Na+-dependent transporter